MEREKSNENTFTSVREINYTTREEIKETENNSSRATRRICNLNSIEACLNKNCSCLCFANDILEDFIEYCYSIDKSLEKLKVIKKRIQIYEKKGTIIINDTGFWIVTTVEVS